MRPTTQRQEIDCREVWQELVNYMEDDLTPEMRDQIERHLRECAHCTAVYDGAQNVVCLLGDESLIELPPGFSRRLHDRVFSAHR